MKFLSWIVFTSILFISLFKLQGADLSTNVLLIALMLLLVTLFSDLKEFDFWGLKGKKIDRDLKKVEGKPAILAKKEPSKKEVAKAERQNILPLNDTRQGNYLTLVFEIERLLRIYASVVSKKEISSDVSYEDIVKEMANIGLISQDGRKQFNVIFDLRTILIQGHGDEINSRVLEDATDLATSLYQEMYEWLYQPEKASK